MLILSTLSLSGPGSAQEEFPTQAVAAQYLPGTEPIRPDEMRVISLGSGMPGFSKGQAAASFLVELGSGENFIFDMGTNAMGNLVAIKPAWNTVDKVFLGHLHFDHMGDLSALLIAGVSHGRNIPLRIWGPSGKTRELGTQYAVDRLLEAYNWEFTSKIGRVPSLGYQAVVTEFDYSKVQTVYDENGVVIRSWPAIHGIDGPVSFSLEWNGLKFVYSSDTYPNRWFQENAGNADILIHEAFPTVGQLVSYYRMQPESAWPVATKVHTQPAAAGKVFSATRPRMAVAYHFIYEVRTYDEVWSEIRTTYEGPLTLARDFLVWNITEEDISVREVIPATVSWPSVSKNENAVIELDKREFPSDWLMAGGLEMSDVDREIFSRLSPEVQARISQYFPEMGAE